MKRVESNPPLRPDIESIWASVFPSNALDSPRHLVFVVELIFRMINIVIERGSIPNRAQIDDFVFKREKVQNGHVTDAAWPIRVEMILPFSFQGGLANGISV